MSLLTKEEKLNKIFEITKEFQITAYEISQNTNITEAGIQRILTGRTKNPHENSINEILAYLKSRYNDIIYDTNTAREKQEAYIKILDPKTKKPLKGYEKTLNELNEKLNEKIIERNGLTKRYAELDEIIELLQESIKLVYGAREDHKKEIEDNE